MRQNEFLSIERRSEEEFESIAKTEIIFQNHQYSKAFELSLKPIRKAHFI